MGAAVAGAVTQAMAAAACPNRPPRAAAGVLAAVVAEATWTTIFRSEPSQVGTTSLGFYSSCWICPSMRLNGGPSVHILKQAQDGPPATSIFVAEIGPEFGP